MTQYKDPPKWGVSHTLALAMTALDLDVVHRSTLRALLPKGRVRPGHDRTGLTGRAAGRNVIRRTQGLDAASRHLIELGLASDPTTYTTRTDSSNTMSDAFQKALARFEREGWISRGTTFVLVRDRRALLDWATSSAPPEDFVLDLAGAIQRINDDLANDVSMTVKAQEQRRQELLAIKRLMEQHFGSRNWSGRGSVRFFPRSHTL